MMTGLSFCPDSLAIPCEPAGIRTLDQEIKSLLLYR